MLTECSLAGCSNTEEVETRLRIFGVMISTHANGAHKITDHPGPSAIRAQLLSRRN